MTIFSWKLITKFQSNVLTSIFSVSFCWIVSKSFNTEVTSFRKFKLHFTLMDSLNSFHVLWIIHFLKDCENITIVRIPAHVSLLSNELADVAANVRVSLLPFPQHPIYSTRSQNQFENSDQTTMTKTVAECLFFFLFLFF